MIRCNACAGKKKLLALGNIMKECPYCKGVGYIEIAEDEAQELPVTKRKPKNKPKAETVLHV